MKTLFFIGCILCATNMFGQSGTVTGKVLDNETGEELLGAYVYNQSKTVYRLADMDGSFSLKLTTGEQYVVVEYIGYEKDSIFVNVIRDETIKVVVKLKEQVLGPGVLIVGKQDKKTTAAVIANEKESGLTTSQIGKEAMDKADVSTSDQAVAKTAGATVEDGKYVYIRGLSDRYSKTTINGFEIPGLDPNRNSVQMDLIPTTFLDKISVFKSFSPDLPASFTGGLVDLETKEFPEDFMLSASVKFGFNSQSSFNKNFLSQSTRGQYDFLGFDDGTRETPAKVQSYSTEALNDLYLNDNEELNELGRSFSRDFEPVRKMSLFNQSYSLAIGNRVGSLDSSGAESYPKIGYTGGISYRKNYSFYENGKQGRYNLVGNVQTDESLNPELELKDAQGNEDVLWSVFGNISTQISKNSKIGLTAARFQNGVSTARYLEGNNYNDANDLYFQTRTLDYQERSLTSIQLKGDHKLSKSEQKECEFTMHWQGAFTQSNMVTPELKFFTNDYTINDVAGESDTIYNLQPQLYSDPSQFSRSMQESNTDLQLHFIKCFKSLDHNGEGKKGMIKFGGTLVRKERIFNERRYDFAQQSGNILSYDGNVQEYMADANFDAGNFTNGFIYLQDASEKRNSYLGNEQVLSVYGMGDFFLFERMRIVTGIRVEMDSISTKSFSPVLSDSLGGFKQLDVLPALNTTYVIKEGVVQLRAGYYRTVARPTFRELAPFSSFDFAGGNVYVGNKSLKRTLIDNLDIRLEYYPSPLQKVSVGGFAKFFNNPIERAFNPEASNAELTWRNVDNAKVYGLEFDYSIRLDSIGKMFKNLAIGGNFTYVHSEVRIPNKEYHVILSQNPHAEDTRRMFGQAPFIVNLNLAYDNIETGLSGNINFGVSGKKLSVVTIGGTPNVYENARPNLGMNVSKNLGRNAQWTIKVSALNLLNPSYKQVYEFNGQEYVFSEMTRGRTINIGLKYSVLGRKGPQ